MYKAIVLLIVFLGILFIAISVVKVQAGLVDHKPEIEYRYIPRTFAEEQMEPVYVSEIFETMFSQPSPWIMSVRSYDQRKQEKVNAYFVSQL
jgi:hypothetical protein